MPVEIVRPMAGAEGFCRLVIIPVSASMMGVRLTCRASKSRTYEMLSIEKRQMSE